MGTVAFHVLLTPTTLLIALVAALLMALGVNCTCSSISLTLVVDTICLSLYFHDKISIMAARPFGLQLLLPFTRLAYRAILPSAAPRPLRPLVGRFNASKRLR